MDTTLTNVMIHFIEKQDSLQYKADAILKKVSGSRGFMEEWGGILGVVLGAAVGFLFQLISDKRKEKKKNEEDIAAQAQKATEEKTVLAAKKLSEQQAIVHKLKLDVGLLSYSLNELAYLYADNRAQDYYARKEKGTDGGKRALEEVYGAYKYISAEKQRLGELTSGINTGIARYYLLGDTPIPGDISTAQNDFIAKTMNLERAINFETETTTFAEEYKAEHERLRNLYQKILNDFSNILRNNKIDC